MDSEVAGKYFWVISRKSIKPGLDKTDKNTDLQNRDRNVWNGIVNIQKSKHPKL